MEQDIRQLDAVFGEGSTGMTPEERANSSRRLFVRSRSQLAYDSAPASGRRLTAREALDAFGWAVLSEVDAEGSAVLSSGPKAAGQAIRLRREALGLELKHVARRAGLSEAVVAEAEESGRSIPLQIFERIAQALGMDERFVSARAQPVGTEQLAVRLRTLGRGGKMSATEVAAIAEAAWVAATQNRLERALGLPTRIGEFTVSSNYGDSAYPAYQHGYYLADETRRKLGLGDRALEPSLREICEDILGIPVIQAELGEWIAGVTVQAGDARAIVINVSGRNGRRVFVRRSTLAHELGHLLWDPDDRLESLAVDTYEDLERAANTVTDRVEQRANAFSVQFIAPQEAVLGVFQNAADYTRGVADVMEAFGISFTAARYQIWNGLNQRVPLSALVRPRQDPTQNWEGKESYAIDWNPLNLPPSRAGRFSAVVVRAAEVGIISWDTAAEYLLSSIAAVREAVPALREMFPAAFAG